MLCKLSSVPHSKKPRLQKLETLYSASKLTWILAHSVLSTVMRTDKVFCYVHAHFIRYCRMTNYELLRRLVETPSRDIRHYRMLNVSALSHIIKSYFKLLVGHTTKQMKHGRSCVIQIWWLSVENVALGLRPRVTFSTSGRYISHVPLTTVRVVWLTTSCFADWSKRRHVTLSIIEWRTIHGHDLVTIEKCQEVVWHVKKCQTVAWHVNKYLMSRERRHVKNVKRQEITSSITARSLNQT